MEATAEKLIGKRPYNCHFELTLQIIGGKWKPLVLYHLGKNEVLRFGELKRKIPNITEKMLVQQLRELEADGMVQRKVYQQVPPKVEYSLNEIGKTIIPILDNLQKWGVEYEETLINR